MFSFDEYYEDLYRNNHGSPYIEIEHPMECKDKCDLCDQEAISVIEDEKFCLHHTQKIIDDYNKNDYYDEGELKIKFL